jgi:enterochelin esterase-like enzyme
VLGTGGWAFNDTHPTVLPRLLGGCHGVDAPAAGAVVTRGRLPSRAMGGDVGYALATPPGHPGPMPVVVALHGRGGSADAVMAMGFHEFVAAAVTAGRCAPFAVAAVDGGDSTYWHRRASGLDPMTMVLDEFVPMLAARGLGGSRASTAVLGWSMGGYGALLAGETAPEVFGAVVATSPAFWETYSAAAGAHDDTFDGEADWRAHDVAGHVALLEGMPVRFDCGDLDPFAPVVRRLQAKLPGSAGGISPGCHDDGFSRSVAAEQVSFLAAHFAQ